MMKPKTLFKEFSILLITYLILWLIAFWRTERTGLYTQHVISFNTGYFIGAWSKFILIPYILLVILMYFAKEAFFKYQRTLQNFILLIAVFCFNIMLFKFPGVIYGLASSAVCEGAGCTIYPPLSALPKHNPNPDLFINWIQILFYIQIFFLLLLVIVAILTGKNWNPKDDKTLYP